MAEKILDFAGRNIRLQKQDQIYWCYAAVVSALSKWLNNGTAGWSPCEIASWAVMKNLYQDTQSDEVKDEVCNCCQKVKPSACVDVRAVGNLSQVLPQLNITYNRMAGRPDFSTIQDEIDNDRPLLLALKAGKIGHVSMVIGYRQPKNSTGRLVLYDPSAYKIPRYQMIADLRTMSFEIPYIDLVGNFPTEKHTVSYHYINVIQNAAVPAVPAWMAFHE